MIDQPINPGDLPPLGFSFNRSVPKHRCYRTKHCTVEYSVVDSRIDLDWVEGRAAARHIADVFEHHEQSFDQIEAYLSQELDNRSDETIHRFAKWIVSGVVGHWTVEVKMSNGRRTIHWTKVKDAAS